MIESPPSGEGMDRRGFLKLALRCLALAGLAYLGLRSLGQGGAAKARSADSCEGDGLCPCCPGLQGCAHPQALAYARGKKP